MKLGKVGENWQKYDIFTKFLIINPVQRSQFSTFHNYSTVYFVHNTHILCSLDILPELLSGLHNRAGGHNRRHRGHALRRGLQTVSVQG